MKPRIYLDNAATAHPRPPEVLAAVTSFLNECGASPGRGSYGSAVRATRLLETTRRRTAEYLGVGDPLSVSFHSGATAALNLVLRGWLRPGDRVITSSMEHNAVARPLRRLQAGGVQVERIPSPGGLLDLDLFEKALKQPARLAAIIHGSNLSGAVNPLDRIARLCEAASVPLLVDAAQTAGHLHVAAPPGVAALAFSAHKGLMAVPGLGCLYLRAGFRPDPLVDGGTGDQAGRDTTQPDPPACYEAGTANMPAVASLLAALDWRAVEGEERVMRRPLDLAAKLRRELALINGVDLPGTGEAGLPLVSFNLEGWPPADLAAVLDAEWGIECRAGLHCAPWAHEELGTVAGGGAVRASPGYFSSDSDVLTLVTALRALSES